MAYYRPKFRTQKPPDDPTEPQGGEGRAKGDEHAWNGCVAYSGAMALDYHTKGRKRLWGGQIRHALRNPNGRRPGPTLGLDDLQDAWQRLGYQLEDWSGRGWDDVLKAHRQGRAIVIQGKGDCPGKGTYRGPHCGLWVPDGAWGDPLTNRWQRVEQAAIRRWAENWNSSISFAVTRARQP